MKVQCLKLVKPFQRYLAFTTHIVPDVDAVLMYSMTFAKNSHVTVSLREQKEIMALLSGCGMTSKEELHERCQRSAHSFDTETLEII